MYRLFDLIRAVRNALMPYEVEVFWEGKYWQHRAWNRNDALSWFKCYPVSSWCAVYPRFGKRVVMQRQGDAA